MEKIETFFRRIGEKVKAVVKPAWDKVSTFCKPVTDKIKKLWHKSAPVRGKIVAFCTATGKWTYRLRSIVMSIPVAAVAVILAVRNMAVLPSAVPLGFPSVKNGVLLFGEVMIVKSLAVFAPLLLTAFCLLMVLLSKRPTFPWLVSIFSLFVPIFLGIAAVLPA